MIHPAVVRQHRPLSANVSETGTPTESEYKRKVLAEAEACTKPGEIGALLRREGLYSSHLVEWRRACDSGALAGLAPRKRGPAAKVVHPLERKVAELEREVARATRRAERAEGLVALQKKVSELLGIQLPTPDEEP